MYQMLRSGSGDVFDFTTVIDRAGTGSLKYEAFAADVLPVWVADMDFRSPPCVLQALHRAVDHGIFGYSTARRELKDVLLERLSVRHHWQVKAEALVFLPGLVGGLNLAARLLPDGAEVLIPTPAYPPFLSCAPNQRKTTVRVPMKQGKTAWTLDFEALQAGITPKTAMLILCNPHNPTGRCFTRDELAQIASFVDKNDLILVSDEIHCDIMLSDTAVHRSIAAEFPEIASRTITLLSPSKTFNLAGLGCAFAVIEDADLRKRFAPVSDDLVPYVSQAGYCAMEAAYRDGEPWRQALIARLRENCRLVEKAVSDCRGLCMIPPEATYLAWIDCRALGLDDPAALLLAHKLAVGSGRHFGMDGFIRINFACPPATLKEAMKRLTSAIGA
jgi:cysteine-S-conjugate beta-lyase